MIKIIKADGAEKKFLAEVEKRAGEVNADVEKIVKDKGHLLTINLNLLNHAHYATPPSSSSVVTGIYTALYQSL